jgi:ribonuclease Z
MLAEEAAALARAASAHALILTHFSPKITDVSIAERTARRFFPNTRSGRDGMIVTLEYPN